MSKTKTWDDYLTQSGKVEDNTITNVNENNANLNKSSSRNPFLKNSSERGEIDNQNNTAITSEPVNTTTTEETSLTETVVKNPNDKNTLDSLESIDSFGFGETKGKSTRERFLLFDGIRDTTSGSSSKVRKDVFDNHLKEAMRSAKHGSKSKHRHRSSNHDYKGPKIFGNNFKYMKGYLKNSLPLSELGKENKSTTETPSTTSTDVTSAEHMTKLQQELKFSRRKIQNLKETSTNAVRRKDELKDEVLAAHKEITDLKIALQTSCDKQHEYEIEMRIAKSRVGEAEREAAIAIGNSNKLEKDYQDAERKRQENWDKLIAAEEKINGLETSLVEAKEKHRDEIEEKQKLQQQQENKQYELKRSLKDVEELKSTLSTKESEIKELVQQSEQLMQEKARCEGQIEELTKSNASHKEELAKIRNLYTISERSLETSNQRIAEQKEKFEAMISSRVQIENELSEMHKELSKQKVEKQSLSQELTRLLDSFKESEVLTEKYRTQYEDLENENSKLKDKVLYFDLYRKALDSKSLSLDELKLSEGSKPLTLSSKSVSQKSSVNENNFNSKELDSKYTSKLKSTKLDIERITRKLCDIKDHEEAEVIQKYIEPIVKRDSVVSNPMSPNNDESRRGSRGSHTSHSSIFDITANESKPTATSNFGQAGSSFNPFRRNDNFENIEEHGFVRGVNHC